MDTILKTEGKKDAEKIFGYEFGLIKNDMAQTCPKHNSNDSIHE
jgi:hypothetical protein